MRSLQVLALSAALVLAPMSAIAAPAGSMTASSYADTFAPPVDHAIVRGDEVAKVDKVWWRGRGWHYGWRGFGWRRPIVGFYGWRRPWVGYYGWHPPYWRGRWVY